jgi:CBS domain-containing protein
VRRTPSFCIPPIDARMIRHPHREDTSMTVAAMLKHKGHDVVSVQPTASVAEISRLLSARRIGAVLVRNGMAPLLGLVSERDIIHALAANGARALEMTAAQLMTHGPQCATPETTITEAMEMMTEGRFRHLPVLDHGELVGIVSIGDVVKARIMQQAQEVDSLKAYVAGAA